MKLIIGLAALILFLNVFASSPKSQSIQHAKALIQDHPFTFFCQKPIEDDFTVFARQCDVCPEAPIKIKWMGIVPTKRLAQDRSCYTSPICVNSNGKPYKGIQCCRKTDKLFIEMDADLHNLVPEEPFLSKLNVTNHIAEVKASKGQFICDLRHDYKAHTIQPPEFSKGMLARTYLYYADQYRLNLEVEERRLFLQWHYEYPPTSWEKKRNAKIYAETGKLNTWIH